MPVKTPADVGELAATPPPDYCPGRSQWATDPEDVFWVAPELRAAYCHPDAGPSQDQTRKLWNRAITLNRVVRERGGRYVWAPPIPNTGGLALLRPSSPDEIVVDPSDELHVSAWKHVLRRDKAAKQVFIAEDSKRREAALPRCEICSTLLVPSPPDYRPWTKGGGRLCSPCSETVNLAGALRHLETHQAAIASWLEARTPARG